MNFILRVKKKFAHAFIGIKIAFLTDNSFKAHLVFSLLAFIGGIVWELATLEWVMVVFAVGLVIVAELFNTAIEHLIRIFTPDYSELAKALLDISAGAVLFASIVAFITACLIFIPRIFDLLP